MQQVLSSSGTAAAAAAAHGTTWPLLPMKTSSTCCRRRGAPGASASGVAPTADERPFTLQGYGAGGGGKPFSC